MRLPEVQARMRELTVELAKQRLALDLIVAELQTLEREISRRKSFRVAPRSRPMSPIAVRAIKELKRLNNSLTQHEIAEIVGVNVGRVSEVLSGKRT